MIESDDDEQVNTVDFGSGQERLTESKERFRENEVEESGESGGGERKSHSSWKEMRDWNLSVAG